MLAQLDAMPGVAESRVDWAGEHVLLRLTPGAKAGDVVGRALAALGKGATRLDSAAERERIDSFRRGDAWMRAGETVRLSRHEAGVLGSRFAREAGAAAGLDERLTKRLEAVLTEEIGALFERMHASGITPDDVPAERLRDLERRIRERCADFASAAQVDAIVRELKTNLGMCEREE